MNRYVNRYSGAIHGDRAQQDWKERALPHSKAPGVFAVVETWLAPVGRTPLRAAKDLGLRTVFLTSDLSAYAATDAARAELASCVDEFVTVDTQSTDAVVKALAPLGGQLRGVFSTNDYNVTVVAEAAEALGLPGLSPRAAHGARHKLRTRERCGEAGVPVPRWHWAHTEEDARACAAALGLPCVVKPMTDAAGIGVRLCRTPDEVAEQYRWITGDPKDFRGGTRTPGVLLEEYLVGFEVSVEIVAVDGAYTVLGVTDKALGPHPHFVEIGETFPSLLPEHVQQSCVDTALAALGALGHDFGAAHVEIRMTADGPRLVEVNARMPGAWITRLIRESTGVDLPRELVRLHTGDRPDLAVRTLGGAASRYLTAPDDGTLRAVRGEDIAARVPGVVEVEVHAEVGDRVRRARDNVDVCGSVVALGSTAGEAARRADAAIGQLALDVGPLASDVGPLASDVGQPASYVGQPASGIGQPALETGRPALEVRQPALEAGP
jgi:biotin carboxylase